MKTLTPQPAAAARPVFGPTHDDYVDLYPFIKGTQIAHGDFSHEYRVLSKRTTANDISSLSQGPIILRSLVSIEHPVAPNYPN